jgi:hypothetical protein
MEPNLYDLAVSPDDVDLTTYCGGNLGSGMETCLVVGKIPGTDDSFIVGDNKQGAGDPLRMTGPELDNFALRWVQDRGLSA